MQDDHMILMILLSLILLILLYIVVQPRCVTKKDIEPKKESFCTCQGMERKTCNNPQVMQALYNTNTLTEYTDLRKFQDTSCWKNAAPYDQFYQYQQKCNSCGQCGQPTN